MNKKTFAILFCTMFMIMLGVGIIIPHLNYYAQEMGATSFQIGLLIATYPIVQFFVSPFFWAVVRSNWATTSYFVWISM